MKKLLTAFLIGFASLFSSCRSTGIINTGTELSTKLNFDESPGVHISSSPVVGSRMVDYMLVINAAVKNPSFFDFTAKIYNCVYTSIIPKDRENEAVLFSRSLFADYIKKYGRYDINVDNVVFFTDQFLPHPGLVTFREYPDGRWILRAIVEKREETCAEIPLRFVNPFHSYIRPKYVRAAHEVRHLEQISRVTGRYYLIGDSQTDDGKILSDLVPTLLELTLQDQIYKKIHGFNLDDEMNYFRVVNWGSNEADVGAIANFYRSLERKYSTLERAVASTESINFINGVSRLNNDKRIDINY